MQRVYRDLLVIQSIARDLAAFAEEDEAIGRVPALNHVQPFMDLTPQRLLAKVAAEESGLRCFAQLGQCLVGRMLDIAAGETSQDRLQISRALGHGRRVAHHLVVLLLDQRPIDRARQNAGEVQGAARPRSSLRPRRTSSAAGASGCARRASGS